MVMLSEVFSSSMKGSSYEDAEDLGRHLMQELPADQTDRLRSVLNADWYSKLSISKREGLLRSAIQDVMDELIQRSSVTMPNTTTVDTPVKPPEESKSDRALRRAQETLRGISDASWETMARTQGKSVEEVRQDTWKKLYEGYLID